MKNIILLRKIQKKRVIHQYCLKEQLISTQQNLNTKKISTIMYLVHIMIVDMIIQKIKRKPKKKDQLLFIKGKLNQQWMNIQIKIVII